MQNSKHNTKINSQTTAITVLTKNAFKKKVQDISYPGLVPISTFFTDLQAKNICSKMRDNKIRHFSELFLSGKRDINNELLRYQIHLLANKALSFFGGKILTFIYQLNRWPKITRNIDILISSLNDLNNKATNFPKLEINSIDNEFSYTVNFKRAYERAVDYSPLFSIRNNNSRNVSKVSKDGLLVENFENAKVEILIFLEHLDGDFALYSGYDDDLCDICGRPLTDYYSIYYGRGPICRMNYGMPL